MSEKKVHENFVVLTAGRGIPVFKFLKPTLKDIPNETQEWIETNMEEVIEKSSKIGGYEYVTGFQYNKNAEPPNIQIMWLKNKNNPSLAYTINIGNQNDDFSKMIRSLDSENVDQRKFDFDKKIFNNGIVRKWIEANGPVNLTTTDFISWNVKQEIHGGRKRKTKKRRKSKRKSKRRQRRKRRRKSRKSKRRKRRRKSKKR